MANVKTPGVPVNQQFRSALMGLPFDEVTITRRLHGGMSGAGVFLGHVSPYPPNQPTSEVILKVASNDVDDEGEPSKHGAAENSPLKDLVPKLVGYFPTDACTALAYTVANGSLHSSISLQDRLNSSGGPVAVKAVAGALRSWYGGEALYATPQEFIHQFFKGGRIERIRAILEGYGLLSSTDHPKSVLFTGAGSRPVANPGWLFTELGLGVSEPTIKYPAGPVHGDLHTGNILCSPDVSKPPTVIDFGLYKNPLCSFFDYLYLEFSVLINCFPVQKVGERDRWTEVVDFLSKTCLLDFSYFSGTETEVVFLNNILPLRRVINQWISESPSDYLIAFHLTGTAVGLNWMSKRNISDSIALAALQYASYHLDSAFRLLGVPTSFAPATVDWATSTVAPAYSSERRLVESELLPRVTKGSSVFVIGPSAAKFIGAPTDRDIARQVYAKIKGGVLSVSEQPDDPIWLETIAAEGVSEVIRRLVAEYGELPSTGEGQARSVLSHLAGYPLLSVLSWAFASKLHQLFQDSVGTTQRVVAHAPHSQTVDIFDSSNVSVVYWVFLRGSTSNLNSLVIDNWHDKSIRDAREQMWESLQHSTLPGLCIVFWGFKEPALELLLPEVTSLLGSEVQIWLIHEDIRNFKRSKLWEAKGLRLVSLPAEEFDFILAENKPTPLVHDIGVRQRTLSFRNHTDGSYVDESVPLDDGTLAFLNEYFEVLYDDIEEQEPEHAGRFLLGYPITWAELHDNVDVPRTITPSIRRSLEHDLAASAVRRYWIECEPGAGSTTLGARLAWDAYAELKVPVIRITRTGPGLLQRVEKFHKLVNRSFVIIVDPDWCSTEEADVLHDELFEAELPAIVVIFARQQFDPTVEQRRKSSEIVRSFQLCGALDDDERQRLLTRLSEIVSPERLTQLKHSPTRALFLLLVQAFEEKFVALPHTVRTMLDLLGNDERRLLKFICFTQVYAFRPAQAFALAAWAGRNTDYIAADTFVRQTLRRTLDRAVITTNRFGWDNGFTTIHDLVASEMLRQLLSDQPTFEKGLSDLSAEIVRSMKNCRMGYNWRERFVAQLVTGTNYMWFTPRKVRGSRLMASLGKIELQRPVLDCAASAFPNNAHIRAHYGRLLYEQTNEFETARQQLDEARRIAKRDDRIAHMEGMSYRRELDWVLAGLRHRNEQYDANKVARLLKGARTSFAEARDLNRQNAYAYVSDIECLTVMIELSLSQAGAVSLLELPENSEVYEWLQEIDTIMAKAELEFSGDLPTELLNAWGKAQRYRGKPGDLQKALSSSSRSPTDPRIKYELARSLLDEVSENSAGYLSAAAEAATLVKPSRQISRDWSPSVRLWTLAALRDPKTSLGEVVSVLQGLWTASRELEIAYFLMASSFLGFLQSDDPTFRETFEEFRVVTRRMAEGRLRFGHKKPRDWVSKHYRVIPNTLLRHPKLGGVLQLELLAFEKAVVIEANRGRIQILPPNPIEMPVPVRRNGDRVIFDYDLGRRVSCHLSLTLQGPIAHNVQVIRE